MMGRVDGERIHAFVAADEVAELVVVVIAEPAAQRFEIAAVFVIVVVAEVAVSDFTLVIGQG